MSLHCPLFSAIVFGSTMSALQCLHILVCIVVVSWLSYFLLPLPLPLTLPFTCPQVFSMNTRDWHLWTAREAYAIWQGIWWWYLILCSSQDSLLPTLLYNRWLFAWMSGSRSQWIKCPPWGVFKQMTTMLAGKCVSHTTTRVSGKMKRQSTQRWWEHRSIVYITLVGR